MEHGKPQKQALAIAYKMRRMARGGMAKKYADGGCANDDMPDRPAPVASGYAEGGQIEDNYESPSSANHQTHDEDRFHEEELASGYGSMPMESAKENHNAEMEDARDLNQHGEDETGPMGAYAEGGEIDDLDMVGHIMKKRQMCYSEGGKVANDDHINDKPGFAQDTFDVLPMEDDLESSYTGANSGDELGDSDLDHPGDDVVSRMMRARRDRTPNTGMPGYGRGRRVG